MPRAYYCTVFDQPAEVVWRTVRDFGYYSWAGTGIEAEMEGGKAGDAIGGVRRVGTPGQPIRQRLLAHSDADRFYSYEFCEPLPFPVRHYRATLRITPVTEDGRAFTEWWATFECDEQESGHWVEHVEHGFARWLASLRGHIGS